MANDLEDLDSVKDDFSDEIIKIDFTEETLKIRKKLLRKIWVVFGCTFIIVGSLLFDKHNDFDVVLESTLFRSFLYVTIGLSITAFVFSLKNKSKYNEAIIYKRHKSFSEVLDVLYIIPIFMAVISLSNEFMISPSFIDGASMEPNYYDGDDILFWHLNTNYEKFDVVILKAPSGDYWIKRVIGLPGDDIVIENGIVSVNGIEINQDFLKDENGSIDDNTICRTGDIDFCEFNVPAGSYFVLGDNRDVSDDSRSDNLGYVSEEQLYGKVILKFNNFFRN
jgi:signal peptidase I